MSRTLITEGNEPDSILVVEDDADLPDVLVRALGTICRAVRPASGRAEEEEKAARSWARITTDGVEIDLVGQRVVRHGVPQRLTPTEWALLRALVLHHGRALSPRQLWDLVWDREFGDFSTHVRVHMTHLRRKVEPDTT